MPRHSYGAEDPETLRPGDNHPLGTLGPLFAPVPAQQSSDTSVAAAEAMTPGIVHLRRRVAELYAAVRYRGITVAQHDWLAERGGQAETPPVGTSGLTPDEAAWLLRLSILAVRPRTTELVKAKSIEDAGERRQNESGMTARVLRART